MQKYYKVTCKCGHVGRTHFIRIDFPIITNSASRAASIAKRFPRVKHDAKDAIIDVKEIDKDEYYSLYRKNSLDPYLQCRCIQEQNLIEDFFHRLESEPISEKRVKRTSRRNALGYRRYKDECVERGMDEKYFEYLDSYCFAL